MFLINSRLGLFPATLSSSPRAPLLPKLRGQFAEFLSGASPVRLWILSSPTCVGFQYGHLPSPTRRFSWQCEARHFAYYKFGSPSRLTVVWACGFAYTPPLAAWPGSTNAPVACSSCVPPRRLTSGRWLRNINLIPISYAFRPRLRPRLTLGGFAFPRKPWASDGQASHLPRATYSGILTSASSTLAYALGFALSQNAPLPLKADYLGFKPAASVCGLKPRVFSAPSRSTSELLRTL